MSCLSLIWLKHGIAAPALCLPRQTNRFVQCKLIFTPLILFFRLSSSTERSSSSQLMRRHKRRRRRHKLAKIDRVSRCGSLRFAPSPAERRNPLIAVSFTCALLFLLFQSSSFSSITDSTMSLNIITVTLNMGKAFFSHVWVQPRTPLMLSLLSFTPDREVQLSGHQHCRPE